VLLPDHEAGGFTVEVPDLPGCVTEGDTFEEALEMAEEAIEGFLVVMKKDGDPIPMPTKLDAIVRRTTKSRLKESPIFTTVKVAA
jgi:predicted RNase H-like HicB family nuclease